jgi:hypothetical protein
MDRDADHRTPPGNGHGSAWTVGIVAALLIYTLSPGPVAWWIHNRNGGTEPAWVRWIYAPLIYGSTHFKPIGRAYEVYFEWCININARP